MRRRPAGIWTIARRKLSKLSHQIPKILTLPQSRNCAVWRRCCEKTTAICELVENGLANAPPPAQVDEIKSRAQTSYRICARKVQNQESARCLRSSFSDLFLAESSVERSYETTKLRRDESSLSSNSFSFSRTTSFTFSTDFRTFRHFDYFDYFDYFQHFPD